MGSYQQEIMVARIKIAVLATKIVEKNGHTSTLQKLTELAVVLDTMGEVKKGIKMTPSFLVLSSWMNGDAFY